MFKGKNFESKSDIQVASDPSDDVCCDYAWWSHIRALGFPNMSLRFEVLELRFLCEVLTIIPRLLPDSFPGHSTGLICGESEA